MRDSIDAEASFRGLRYDRLFGDSIFRPQNDVSAGSIASDLDAVAKECVNCVEERFAARGVSATQPPKVTLVHSHGDEFSESLLLQGRGMQIAEPLCRCERGNERTRRYKVADA
jgi:hypothetical protein